MDYPRLQVGAATGVSATVYPPKQLGHEQASGFGFYRGPRYDWLSMIGSIQVPMPEGGGHVTLCSGSQPPPHQPDGPDYGLGLATEFGCGVHGTICPMRDEGIDMQRHSKHAPPPPPASDAHITNGVLGYGSAGPGGVFLKIGVGKLRRPALKKGNTKPDDGRLGYNISYPYKIAEIPRSTVRTLNCSRFYPEAEAPSRCAPAMRWSGVEMGSTVRLGGWGYRVQRRVRPCGDPDGKLNAGALCVDMRLVNRGDQELTTPYAVGNLFNVQDAAAVGPGYGVSFAMPKANQYKDVPDARPLEAVAVLRLREDGKPSQVMFSREVPEYQRAMASFVVPRSQRKWSGGFSIDIPTETGHSVIVTHSMSEVKPAGTAGGVRGKAARYVRDPIASHSWYGFNVHATKRAIAPRPYSLLTLPKGTSLEWTHRYDFSWRHDF